MKRSRKGSIGGDIAIWLFIVIFFAIAVVAWSQYSHDRAIKKPEFILMNQTCFDFCEDQGLFFSYVDWTGGPEFKSCYCIECDVFVGSVDQETYKTCDYDQLYFRLERD